MPLTLIVAAPAFLPVSGGELFGQPVRQGTDGCHAALPFEIVDLRDFEEPGSMRAIFRGEFTIERS